MIKKNQRIISNVSALILIFSFGYMLFLSYPPVYGCMDPSAINYNSEANTDNGSCISTVYGCTDAAADNYNTEANSDDGSCKFNPLSSIEGTKNCILENGGDWCTPSCSDPSIAFKFLSDGTYLTETDWFGGMHTRGNWSVNSGTLIITPNHASSGILHNINYCPNTEKVPSKQTLQLTDCNKFKVGTTVYYRN